MLLRAWEKLGAISNALRKHAMASSARLRERFTIPKLVCKCGILGKTLMLALISSIAAKGSSVAFNAALRVIWAAAKSGWALIARRNHSNASSSFFCCTRLRPISYRLSGLSLSISAQRSKPASASANRPCTSSKWHRLRSAWV